MNKAVFDYKGKKTDIKCYPNEKIDDITKRSISEEGKNKEDFYSLYWSKILNKNLTLQNETNKIDKARMKKFIFVNMNVDNDAYYDELALKKGKYIQNFECKENIKILMDNHQIGLYDCKNIQKRDFLIKYSKQRRIFENAKIKYNYCKNINRNTLYDYGERGKDEKNFKTKDIFQIEKDKNKAGTYINYNIIRPYIGLKEGNRLIKINNNKININKIRNQILFKSIIKIIIYLIITFIKLDFIESQFSNITLKINGIGNKNIFTSFYLFKSIYYPNIIYINGKKQLTIKNSYDFDQTDNIVNLIWNNSIVDCKYLFYQCSDIVEIDFSNFDTSLVTNMRDMFGACRGLSSLDLSNFDTSLVEDMSYMFNDCSNLLSLNLANFKTSSVKDMSKMFERCSGLFSLNLTNFDTSSVTKMVAMFSGCSSISSLDLSNFNTSLVNDMNHMFDNCLVLSSLDLSNFDTSSVQDMSNMFYNCFRLSSLVLYNFDTSLVKDMSNMFNFCLGLSSLDLSNFNTSLVKDMSRMFYSCKLLSSLIFNFDTSSVKDMKFMFYDCRKLSSLDLSNFDTSLVTSMNSMFRGCSGLTYINLKSFIENASLSYVEIFDSIPENIVVCLNNHSDKLLSEIFNIKCYTMDCSDNWRIRQKKIVYKRNICQDYSNNYISYYYEYNDIYYDTCINGTLLNNIPIKNCICNTEKCLSCPKIPLKEELCFECNSNYYKKENDNYSYIEGYVKCYNNLSGYYLDNDTYKKCYYTCKECEKKGDNKTHNCLICNDNYPFGNKINNYSNCYNNCSYYYYLDDENNYHCTINSTCPEKYPNLLLNQCIRNNEMTNTIEEIISNKDTLLTTKEEKIEYNDSNILNIETEFLSDNYIIANTNKGVQLNNNESTYKKCYYTCKECEKKGDNKTHNCLICNDNYPLKIKINNYSNCYNNCSYYYYFDDEKNYYCTINSTCPYKYPILLERKECVKITKVKYLIEDLLKNEKIAKTKEEEIKYYDPLLKKVEEGFTSENFYTTELDKGIEEIIEAKIIKFTFTTLHNQKNDNMTIIDLGKCELLLRQFYNLTNNELLYLKKLDIIQEGMRIPKIELDIYSKLYGLNLVKLNLSICINSKIFLYIPILIKDNLDILNSSSGYYNDICYMSSTESGTDITLKDRRNEYINKTVCQDNCNFLSYNYTSHKAVCSCKVKESSISLANMKINTKILLENFKNIKNIANLNILKCFKRLFCKEGIINNIGYYILLFIVIFHIISIFVFYIKQYNLLKKKIKSISYAIINLKLLEKGNENDGESEIKLEKISNINNDINNIIDKSNKKYFKKKKKKKRRNKKIQKEIRG